MRTLLLLALLLVPPASAAQQVWAPAPAITVSMRSFAFGPRELRLRAGQPVRLHLENRSGARHNFSAPQFFASAALQPASAGLVRRGTVEVPARGAVDVTLSPAAGTYKLRCTHSLHSMLGMRGKIVVA